MNMKFVAGDESPRQFAEKCINKMNESDLLDDLQQSPQENCQDNFEEIVIRKGGMCFHEGADGMAEDEEQENAQASQIRSRRSQSCQHSGQRPAEIAGDVYNQLLILKMLYQDLQSYGTSYSDELDEMIEETNILIFAMGRIYQTLSRGNRLPIQTFRKPQIRDFCSGLMTTSRFLRRLLSDLRRLQRSVESQNINTQLIIINITLMDQQQELSQIMQYCEYNA